MTSAEASNGNRKILQVSGEIDLSNVRSFRETIDAAIRESPEGFVIDLSGVTYIDSAGIAAIMSGYQRMLPAGRLALVTANGNIKRILTLVHTEELPGFFVLDDLASAEKALSATP